MAVVVDALGLQHTGVVTDADIRRLLLRGERLSELTVAECVSHAAGEATRATRQRKSTARRHPGTMAIDCLRQMQANQITQLVILDGGRPVGVVRLQDLIAAGF